MSSLGNAVGQSINWVTGDEGKTKTTVNVKNPTLQKRIDAGLTDYDTVKSEGQNALKDYITKYLGGEGAASTRTSQEIGNLDRYFNGGVASELAALRANRMASIRDAADRASGYALGNINRSRALSEGGPSSYDRRLALRSIGDIMTQAAVDDTAQQRADWDFLERSRAGYTGQRQRLADALAAYRLAPETMRRQLFGQDLSFLGAIGELDRANKFYGLKYDPSIGEEIGQHVGDLANAAMQAFSIYSGGGFGGGGGQATTSTATNNLPIIPGTSGGGNGWSQSFWGNPYQAPPGTYTNWAAPGGPQSMAPGTDYLGWGSYGGY